MSCKKFRILLSAYLDQEITKDEEEELLEHLGKCADCTRELEHLKKIKKVFLLKKRKEPQEFFETRLLARIKDIEKQPVSGAFFPVFKKSIIVALIFFLLIVGLLNYKNFFYHKLTGITSDVLIDRQLEENFEEELLEIYYGPLG
ncbi:MAG: anti-sigma factor [bacterium]